MVKKTDDDLSVLESVRRDLEDIGTRDPALARSAFAATALALARELDGHNSATSKSMCAKALNETMEKLRALAPAAEAGDEIDELKQRRAKRKRAAG